ncbi:SatD family protein [Amphibacillus sp. Q70]|uniref:SatD family protein n=1 Tax=Amphibacillus sp. Q70 TaxID=3453416 RepID=UPI003F85E31D
MSSDDKYIAIIGDIADSKKIKDRKAFQQKFKHILADINDRYVADMAAKFTITLGDEFQGLVNNGAYIIKMMMEIEMAMAPVELRFGIGIGDITTDIDFNHSTEIDGPAYHRARQMIHEIEKKKSQYTERQSNMMICSDENNKEIDELLNSIFSVCHALKSKWTDRQTEIIYTYLTNNRNQYKTAAILHIGQPSVNKALKAARFYSYQSAMDTVNAFLSRLY